MSRWLRLWCAHCCVNIYFILAFVQNFSHFYSQPLETLEWRLFIKISVHLQMSIYPFTWTHVAGPIPYLSRNFEHPKCWASEVPHPGCLILNCPTIQTVDIFFSLVWEPTCPFCLLNLCFDFFKSFTVLIMTKYWVLDNM